MLREPFFMLLNMMPKAQNKLTRQLEKLAQAKTDGVEYHEPQPAIVRQSAKIGGYTVIYNQHAKLIVNGLGSPKEKPFLDLPLGSVGFLMQDDSGPAAPVRLVYADVFLTGIVPYIASKEEISAFAFSIVMNREALMPDWFADRSGYYVSFCQVLANDDYIFETAGGSKVKSLIHLPSRAIGTLVRAGAAGRAAVELVSTSAHHTFVKPASAAAKNPHPAMGFTIYPKEDKTQPVLIEDTEAQPHQEQCSSNPSVQMAQHEIETKQLLEQVETRHERFFTHQDEHPSTGNNTQEGGDETTG